jgi:DNA mismatch repair protein MutS
MTEHIATTINCRTLFATHYHELTELADLFENVLNCSVAVREWMDEIVFLHRIVPGGTDKSYGIHVAKLAGIPRSVTDRSKEILSELESSFAEEAAGRELSRRRTRKPDADSLFVARNKNVLEKLASADVNALTPLEAMNLLNEIKQQITPETIKETTWQL